MTFRAACMQRSDFAAAGLVIWASSGNFQLLKNEAPVKASESSTLRTRSGPSLWPPSWREGVMGRYENRIRNFSPPERTFEYFASCKKAGHFFMTLDDFQRAITPYKDTNGHQTEQPTEGNAGEDVGSRNPKPLSRRRPIQRQPSAGEVVEYTRRLRALLKLHDILPEEYQAIVNARIDLHITTQVHLKVLEDIGMSNAQFSELLEANDDARPSRSSPLFNMVDLDEDGLMSYEEFMIAKTLLSIPTEQIYEALSQFDKDGSKELDLAAFDQFMTVLRRGTNAGSREVHMLHDYKSSGVYRALFKSSNKLSFEKFLKFVKGVKKESLEIQFRAWDTDQSGNLSSSEFALFLVSKVNVNQTLYNRLMKVAHSEAIYSLDGDISLNDFIDFHTLLDHIGDLEKVICEAGYDVGGLNEEDLMKCALDVGTISKKWKWSGCSMDSVPRITPSIAKTLLALFDADGNGRLSSDEFIVLLCTQSEALDPSGFTLVPLVMGIIRNLLEKLGL